MMPSRLSLPGVRSVAELSEERSVRECLQCFSRDKQWINEQHLQICRIPSPTFLEQRRAEWILAQFRELGCDARIDRAGNVLASVLNGRDGKFVALTAHLDTVLAPRSPEDITVDGSGKLRGPGVSDNGAGLAALLAVARALRASPIDVNGYGLLLIANVGEEGEGNLSGMRYLCRQSGQGNKIQSFLVLDGPTTDHITYQALASRRFEVSFTGPGGHSWSDYGIGNPVHALSRAISLFSDRRSGLSLTQRSSYNFGVVEGGLSINSIPTSARAKVDIRSESNEILDQLSALLNSSMERALEVENDRATGGKLQAKIKEIGSRPGGRLPERSPLLAWLRAVDAHLGIRARLDCASTDANIPLSIGIPAVSIGAGGQGGGAHTPAEWFHPEGREVGLARIFLTLCLILRGLDAPAAG